MRLRRPRGLLGSVIGAVLSLTLASCTSGSSGTGSPAPGAVSASSSADVPNLDPSAPLPVDAPTVAADLTTTTERLRDASSVWTDLSKPAPEEVQLLALHRQRLIAELADSPSLASATLPMLSGSVEREAKSDIAASASIRSGITPSNSAPSFHTRPPPPAGELRAYFDEAQSRFGVAWQVLAAVMLVETRFGRVRSASYASARGPMQFIPSTWKAYGLGGNIHDPHDAILGAANYLAASGAPGDYPAALGHYNPSKSYVKAVWLYARQMMRDPSTFLEYYNWQVFVITTHGDVQLTGPGAAPAS
jgi:Transglycosylase SLT domain